ncbi:MAG: guanitoxin biosynthesis MATE family efflux transporter GntT [Rivularia sp. (in: cyanobacteria)]
MLNNFQENTLLLRFLRLALVNMVSYIMVPLVGIITLAFLGHLSDINQLAGVALSTILFDYLYRTMEFLRAGTTGLTAQAEGRGDREAVLLQGLRNGLIALAIGLAILVLQYPLRELGFALLNATPEVKTAAYNYFNARIWAAPAVTLRFVLIGWFLGQEMNGKAWLIIVVGTTSDILLNYLLVIEMGLGSMGSGVAAAIDAYLMVLTGLILVLGEVQFQEVKAVTLHIWNKSAFKAAFSLNGDIWGRIFVLISTFFLFTNLSSAMGTIFLADNTLLLQIIFLAMYLTSGIGFAMETLTGNFEGQGKKDHLKPILWLGGVTSLLVGLSLALVCCLFPEIIFNLLTDRRETIKQMYIYAPWLLLVLGFGSLSFMLEGYFLGLAEGYTTRNVSLLSLALGFAPLAIASWYFHSNHILWSALSAFMFVRMSMFLWQLPRTFQEVPKEQLGLIN